MHVVENETNTRSEQRCRASWDKVATCQRCAGFNTGGLCPGLLTELFALKGGTLCGIEKLIFYISIFNQKVTVGNWVGHLILGDGFHSRATVPDWPGNVGQSCDSLDSDRTMDPATVATVISFINELLVASGAKSQRKYNEEHRTAQQQSRSSSVSSATNQVIMSFCISTYRRPSALSVASKQTHRL